MNVLTKIKENELRNVFPKMKENTFRDVLTKIKEKAFQLHEEVNQRYGIYSYSKHLNMVGEIAWQYISFYEEKYHLPIMFGAYFHDTIEDARLTYNDVMDIACSYMSEADAYIATEIVYALTNEKGRTRAERANDKYYEGIRNTPFASFVKLCDRFANLKFSKETESKMHKKYISEWEHFINSITNNDGVKEYSYPDIMVKEIVEKYL